MTAVVWRNLLQQILAITADVETDQITAVLSTLSTDDKSQHTAAATSSTSSSSSSSSSSPSYLDYLSYQNQMMMKDIHTKLLVVPIQSSTWSFQDGLDRLLTNDEISLMRRLVNDMDRSKVLTTIVSVVFRPNGFNFCGDVETYYDEHNSYIDSVIIRRKGIPLTLSALTKFVAARCGLKGIIPFQHPLTHPFHAL